MTADEFLEWITGPAERVCEQYGIPAAVVICQGAVESGWGNHRIGEYNIFGRKAVDGDKCITVETQECYDGEWVTIYDEFKDYDSLEEAIDDWCQLMQWGPYADALSYVDASDPIVFIEAIGPIYATDPDYSKKVISTMKACELI